MKPKQTNKKSKMEAKRRKWLTTAANCKMKVWDAVAHWVARPVGETRSSGQRRRGGAAGQEQALWLTGLSLATALIPMPWWGSPATEV